MRLLLKLVILAVAVGSARPAFANFLVQRLPKEGESVHYHFELKKDGKNNALDAELIVSSLTRTIENGEPCRWFEFIIRSLDEAKPKIHSIHKVLVSEKHVGNGKSPLAGIKRIWVAGPALKPQRVDLDFAKSKDAYLFALYLPDPFQAKSDLEEKQSIAYQSGEVVVETGTKATQDFRDGKVQATCEYRFWCHEKVPWGLAHAVVEFQDLELPERPLITTFKITLKKTGAMEKSLLPDAN